jgi:hypothetical protein
LQATLIGRDIYLRHTATDGKSFVQEHRCWDADRFIASQQQAAAKVNADTKPGTPRLAKVEQITANQYRTERKSQ